MNYTVSSTYIMLESFKTGTVLLVAPLLFNT